MTDPRIPDSKRREAELPDDLDQNPGMELFGGHGSEDAQLIAGENMAEGDVENGAPAEPDSGPDDPGRTNE